MDKPIRCAVIGHAPMRFPWGFDEEDSRCRKLKIELAQQIMVLRQSGVFQFLTACDCGVGLYAALNPIHIRAAVVCRQSSPTRNTTKGRLGASFSIKNFAKYRTLRKHSKFGLNTVYSRSFKMSISISRTCYFENKCPQTRMNTGLADSFAKYDTLRKNSHIIWQNCIV